MALGWQRRPLIKITLVVLGFIQLFPLLREFHNGPQQISVVEAHVVDVGPSEKVATNELQLSNNISDTSAPPSTSPPPPIIPFTGNSINQNITNMTNRSWPPTYQLWNYTTQRLDLPVGYHHALSSIGRRPSLLLLQSILDHPQYQNHSRPLNTNDSCYYPNLNVTRDLANRVVQERLRLGLPVLNVGMPKVGSSTLFDFFRCSGWKASHRQNGRKMMLLVAKGDREPLVNSQMGQSDAYLQLDYNFHNCAYPQIQFLDEIHQEFPNATFILNFRPVLDWISSSRQWYRLAQRWGQCRIPGLHCTGPPRAIDNNLTCQDDDLVLWWCSHVHHIRHFVKEYPSHALIELDLYDNEEASDLMAQLFQGNASCWGHANANVEKLANITNATNSTSIPY